VLTGADGGVLRAENYRYRVFTAAVALDADADKSDVVKMWSNTDSG
jgi:hypothetical protein